MIYEMYDGGLITATNEEDLVTKMRNSSFTVSDDIFHYMNQFNERLYKLEELSVKTDNPINFVNDLMKLEIIKINK